MIRTFVDSGVLIYATRAEEPLAQKALDVLKDPERVFASSIFVKLEILPKAIYNSQTEEIEFYEEFFRSVVYWATDIERVIQNAYHQSSQFGLGAMDALHVAAAVSVGATEFVTNEKPNKSIHRTQSIQVISIHSSS